MESVPQMEFETIMCGGSSPLLLPLLILEGVAFVSLVFLLIRNLSVFRRGGLDFEILEQLRLRLLLCKRISMAVGLIVMLQAYQVLMFIVFTMNTGSTNPWRIVARYLGWQVSPVVFGMLIITFGTVQFLILDTLLQYRLARGTANRNNAQHGKGL